MRIGLFAMRLVETGVDLDARQHARVAFEMRAFVRKAGGDGARQTPARAADADRALRAGLVQMGQSVWHALASPPLLFGSWCRLVSCFSGQSRGIVGQRGGVAVFIGVVRARPEEAVRQIRAHAGPERRARG